MRNGGSRAGTVVAVLCAVVCMAAVLRAPINSLGALSMAVQQDTGLGTGVMGLLTTLPLLAFAASALFMDAVANRFGKESVLCAGCVLVVSGMLLRSYAGEFGLFAGTAIMGVGISAGNVLLPAITKERFPAALGATTALYTTTMSVFGGASAGLCASLVAEGFPWRGALMLLAPFAATGAVLWGILRWRKRTQRDDADETCAANSAAQPARTSRLLPRRLLRNPLTWWLTALFAVQSLLFYCTVAWLPSILASRGIDGSTIALCITLFPIVGIPCSMLLPPLAQRLKRQRALGAIVGVLTTLGLVLLCFATTDEQAVVAVVVTGFALSAPFCLCMFYFGARVSDAEDAGRLSSIAQTFGYLFAAIGPTCVGALVDLTGGWDASQALMIALAVTLVACGWKSGTGTIPSGEPDEGASRGEGQSSSSSS